MLYTDVNFGCHLDSSSRTLICFPDSVSASAIQAIARTVASSAEVCFMRSVIT